MPNLASFLTVGYFLDYRYPRRQFGITGIDKRRYAKTPKQELVDLGIALWRKAIASNFEIGKEHVVPLSGGLDSRAILAGLLENTEASNIWTYTFGTPGTLDFDIGNFVAGKLGTRHTQFDLTKHTYRQDELEDVSRRVDQQTVLFHHCPVWDAERLFGGFKVWSGFLGDPLSGSHLPSSPAKDVETAARRFFEKNRYVTSMDLNPGGANLGSLLEQPTVDREQLTFEEQLDLENRQTKFVAPHVLMNGPEYRTPFLYPPWVDFMLSVDNVHRTKQTLYKHILLGAFPSAFGLATKTNRGLPLNASFLKRTGIRLFEARRTAPATAKVAHQLPGFQPCNSSQKRSSVDSGGEHCGLAAT